MKKHNTITDNINNIPHCSKDVPIAQESENDEISIDINSVEGNIQREKKLQLTYNFYIYNDIIKIIFTENEYEQNNLNNNLNREQLKNNLNREQETFLQASPGNFFSYF